MSCVRISSSELRPAKKVHHFKPMKFPTSAIPREGGGLAAVIEIIVCKIKEPLQAQAK